MGVEGNLHQVNIINTDILGGIYDDAQKILKPTLCTLLLILPIVQASLRYYQGAKRIISKQKGSTSAQHQDHHPVDYPPTSSEICTRKNGGYKMMPWGVFKYDEPTQRKKM